MIIQHPTESMVWSYSRLTSYAHCPYEFYLNYIVQDDELYLSEGNFYAELGSYVHEILAMILCGQLSEDDAAQYFLDHYDDSVLYKTSTKIMHKSIIAVTEFFADLDLSWVNQYEVLGVEMRCDFLIENQPFVGFIDLLLRDKKDQRIVIVDHKSTEYPFRQDGKIKKKLKHSFEQYKRQMYLYAHAVWQKYGEYPKSMMWHHFKDRGQLASIAFDASEYQQALVWAKETIKQIHSDAQFDACQDYFYCHNLCNFRHSCEYCDTT